MKIKYFATLQLFNIVIILSENNNYFVKKTLKFFTIVITNKSLFNQILFNRYVLLVIATHIIILFLT